LISELRPAQDFVSINFELEVVNMAAGEKILKRGSIGIPSTAMAPTFLVFDATGTS
jgi:hypothetical protein